MSSKTLRVTKRDVEGESRKTRSEVAGSSSLGRGGRYADEMARGRALRVRYAEHFQPEAVLLGNVQDHVPTFNISLRSITLSQIDQTRALRAEDVHPKAQRFRLSLTIHSQNRRSSDQ